MSEWIPQKDKFLNPWVYQIARLKTTCMFRFDSIRKTRSEHKLKYSLYIQKHRRLHHTRGIENGCTKRRSECETKLDDHIVTTLEFDARLLLCCSTLLLLHLYYTSDIAAASNATAAGLWHKQPEKRIQNISVNFSVFICAFLEEI